MRSALPRVHKVFFEECVEKPTDTPEEIAFALLAMAEQWSDAEDYTEKDKKELLRGAVYLILDYQDLERSYERLTDGGC